MQDVGLVLALIGAAGDPEPSGTARRCGRGAPWRPRRTRAGRPAAPDGRTSGVGCTRCTGSACDRRGGPATYGSTTWRSKSGPKLNTWWSRPRWSATRRASSTSDTEQHPESDSPPQRRSVTPVTWWPSPASSAAATDESTPPLIATRTFTTAAGPRRRARPRAPVTTSASVVVHPSDSRNDPPESAAGTPSAARTCDGSAAPLAHDDAAEAHTPSWSSRNSSASASTPGMQRWQFDATLWARSPVSTAPGMAASSPSARRSRWNATRSTTTLRSSAQARAPAARPTIAATGSDPLRRPRSWPPPRSIGWSRTGSRTTSTPTPLGPPNLCPLSDTRSAGAASSATSSQANACTASVWSSAPGASASTTDRTAVEVLHGARPRCRPAAPTRPRPWARRRRPASTRARSSRSIRPAGSTARHPPAPGPHRVEDRVVVDRAAHRDRPGGERTRTAPGCRPPCPPR